MNFSTFEQKFRFFIWLIFTRQKHTLKIDKFRICVKFVSVFLQQFFVLVCYIFDNDNNIFFWTLKVNNSGEANEQHFTAVAFYWFMIITFSAETETDSDLKFIISI